MNQDPTENSEQIHTIDLAQMADAKSYLGYEFLTWLWFSSESSQCEYSLGRGRTVRFWLDDRLLMESARYRGHTQLLTGGAPGRSREAAVALASGRVVKEMRLGLHIKGVGDFSALLKGDSLEPSSLRLPNIPEQEDNELDARMELVELFSQALDVLFSVFMKERTSPEWNEHTLVAIRNWVQQRNESSSLIH